MTTTAEAFRRRWLASYSAYVGPPTTLLLLWICYRAGWPPLALVASAFYVAFNVLWSVLEAKDMPVTRGSHSRVVVNLVLLAPLGALIGGVDGAWVVAIPMVFGSMGSPTPLQSRYVFGVSAGSYFAGWLLGGVPWTDTVLSAAGLILMFAVTERLWIPLVEGVVQARTRERQLEEALRERDRTLAERKMFLAMMSHEIRTPMNGVLGMTELLERTPLDPSQRDMLEVVRTSGVGLLQIIDDILDLSKLEAGRMAIETVPTDMVQMARDVLSLMSGSNRRPDVSVRYEANGVPPRLAVDPTRLRQVLVNLVGNACKFTEEGEVVLRLHWVAGRLTVEVQDTGIGISEAAQARLFQPFEQGEAGTTRQYGGTGLGLTISQRLVQLMGGLIAVDSTVGVGSIFAFHIDAPSVMGREREPLVVSPTPAAEWRALLVDDNSVNLRVGVAMLERLGCEVVAAAGGLEALDHVQSSWFDLVFLDCQMPDLDGFEACRRLRACGFDRPVLALTAGVTEEELAACYAAGMDDVLTKPTSIKSLNTALRAWAGRAHEPTEVHRSAAGAA